MKKMAPPRKKSRDNNLASGSYSRKRSLSSAGIIKDDSEIRGDEGAAGSATTLSFYLSYYKFSDF